MSDTLYVPPAPPVKRKRHIGLWVIGGLVVLGALSNLVDGSSANPPVSSPAAVSVAPVTPTGYVASNGYVLDSTKEALADTAWASQPASSHRTLCTVLGTQDPNSTTFQVGVRAFAKGANLSLAESQAIVEYMLDTKC